MKTENSKSTSTRGASSTRFPQCTQGGKNSLPLSTTSPAITPWTPFKLHANTLTKLNVERYGEGLLAMNIKFEPDSQNPKLSKNLDQSKFSVQCYAGVETGLGCWGIGKPETDAWWDLIESPDGSVYAVLWKTPFLGTVLSRCRATKESIGLMIETLPALERQYAIACKKQFSPEHVISIKSDSASASINRSIEALSNEAKFLQKKITGQEIIDCVIRVRQLIKRAWKTHGEIVASVLLAENGEDKPSQQKTGKSKPKVLATKKGVSGKQSAMRTVRKPSNGHSSQGRTKRESVKNRNMDGRMPKASRKNRNRKSVGA